MAPDLPESFWLGFGHRSIDNLLGRTRARRTARERRPTETTLPLPAATEGPTSATAAARAPTLAANCTNTSSSDVPSARALPPALPLAWLSGVAGRLMKLPEGRDPEDDALALPGVYT